jgi:microcompartment protein CcmK/EutM
MRIASVIGNVTLSRCHPALDGLRWLIAVPYSQKGLRDDRADGEDLVLCDDLSPGPGQKIAVSEGIEAQMPFYPNKKPIDASCAAILDHVTLLRTINE